MNPELIKDYLAEDNPEAIIYDDVDDAIIGLVFQNHVPILAYSYSKWIDILIKRDRMTKEEAIEFFDFNVSGGDLGEQQPIIIYDMDL